MKKIGIFLVCFFSVVSCFAQLPGSNDPTFNVNDNGYYGDNSAFDFYGSVKCIVEQPDGKIICGGLFTSYNGVARAKIVRINVDGGLDTGFVVGTGFSGASWTVNCLALQTDGKILVGGFFNSYNGTTLHGLARLNTNGSIDSSFTTFTGMTGATATVNSIVIQPD